MKRGAFAFFYLPAVLGLTACAGSKADLPPPKLYTLHGTVLRLDSKDRTATIKGDPIPGWMEAMTMDYPVKDEKAWKALRPNEVITATVEVRETEYAIYDVKAEQAAEQPE